MSSFVRAAGGALALLLGVVGGVAAQAGSPPTGFKIGYINSQKIIAEAPGRAEAEAQIQKEMDAYRSEVQRMGDSLQAMVAAYDKAEPTLSPAAKQGRQKEIQNKQSEYQRRVQELEQKAQQRQAELVGPIMQQINKIIEQVRQEEGYAMIFDAGNQAGVVVAADSNLDITDKVIAKLKASGSGQKGAPQKEAVGPTPKPTGPIRHQDHQ
jgi:outer membrane protein